MERGNGGLAELGRSWRWAWRWTDVGVSSVEGAWNCTCRLWHSVGLLKFLEGWNGVVGWKRLRENCLEVALSWLDGCYLV